MAPCGALHPCLEKVKAFKVMSSQDNCSDKEKKTLEETGKA